jgi:Zn-dependent protease with chaperone function
VTTPIFKQVQSPTDTIELDFARYLEKRHQKSTTTWTGATPDYTFPLEQKLRQQIGGSRSMRSLVQLVVAMAVVPANELVSPMHYPEVSAAADLCARRLGLKRPQVVITPSAIPEIYALIPVSSEPVIVLSSSLTQLRAEELNFVIGHAFGHIANGHGIYHTAETMLTNPLARSVGKSLVAAGVIVDTGRFVVAAIQGILKQVLTNWSQAAEVTSDRAGLICCGQLEVAQHALVKQMVGAEGWKDVNPVAYLEQLRQMTVVSSLAPLEPGQSRLPLPQRLAALQLFANSKIFHKRWPANIPTGDLLSKENLDLQCMQILGMGIEQSWKGPFGIIRSGRHKSL